MARMQNEKNFQVVRGNNFPFPRLWNSSTIAGINQEKFSFSDTCRYCNTKYYWICSCCQSEPCCYQEPINTTGNRASLQLNNVVGRLPHLPPPSVLINPAGMFSLKKSCSNCKSFYYILWTCSCRQPESSWGSNYPESSCGSNITEASRTTRKRKISPESINPATTHDLFPLTPSPVRNEITMKKTTTGSWGTDLTLRPPDPNRAAVSSVVQVQPKSVRDETRKKVTKYPLPPQPPPKR